MKVLTEPRSIRDALSALRPSKVAVAFVGLGWKNYVSAGHLKEIVLSPSLGSNPKAIEELMAAIGDENVHFLDHLHSKFYLGDAAALLGSNNLSDNGLGDGGLVEAAVLLEKSNALRQLETAFRKYKAEAKQQYPTIQAKRARLRLLMSQWNSAVSHGYVIGNSKVPHVARYTSGLDRIHVAWYGTLDVELNEDAIRSMIPEAQGDPLDYFEDFLQFHEDDDVKPGDWILNWQCRNDGYPRKNGAISWMYAHHVVPHGFADSPYTKLVGEAKQLQRPPEPFKLDRATKQLIRDTLSSGDFPQLLSLDDAVWRLKLADAVTPRFIARLRNLANIS